MEGKGRYGSKSFRAEGGSGWHDIASISAFSSGMGLCGSLRKDLLLQRVRMTLLEPSMEPPWLRLSLSDLQQHHNPPPTPGASLNFPQGLS